MNTKEQDVRFLKVSGRVTLEELKILRERIEQRRCPVFINIKDTTNDYTELLNLFTKLSSDLSESAKTKGVYLIAGINTHIAIPECLTVSEIMASEIVKELYLTSQASGPKRYWRSDCCLACGRSSYAKENHCLNCGAPLRKNSANF